jgi:hypothetical protein
MSGHTPWSEIRHKADPSHITALRDELERIGASYGRAGPARYIALHDAGDEVWLRGPPASGLHWQGAAGDALEHLSMIDDGAGPDAAWAALQR